MRTEHTTTLVDAHGVHHEYHLHQHPATEGLALLQEVMGILAGPLAKLLAAVIGRDGDVDAVLSESGFGDILSDLDGEKVAAGFESLAINVAGAGPEVFHRLLAHTTRDNERLASKFVFDRVYQGNYGELLQAATWALRANFEDALNAIRPLAAGSPTSREPAENGKTLG